MKSSMCKFVVLLLCPLALVAQSLQGFGKRVTEFTLPNGMHFIIFERHEAPVVSFNSYVNAGSVDDPSGETGIAHMFEHMAFKGTETIGSKNYPAQKRARKPWKEKTTPPRKGPWPKWSASMISTTPSVTRACTPIRKSSRLSTMS